MRLIDGLINLASRLGTRADKASSSRYVNSLVYDPTDIEGAFQETWLGKIVCIPAEDAVREGITWQADDAQIEKIEAEANRLELWPKVLRTEILSRKDGSAGLYMGGIRGNSAMPLNMESIQAGELKYLTVFERDEISPGPRNQDMLSADYGKPVYYTLGNDRIHPSRIIWRTNGQKPRHQWDGHGVPVWNRVRQAIVNSDTIAAAVASLTHEAKVDVIKLKDFMANIPTQEYENHVMKRFEVVGQLKSIVNALVIDAEDEWNQKTLNFAGFPDIQDRALQIMCGLADIPATRLLGQSPGGLNSTGASDLKNYYDNVAARQKLEIGPALHPLFEVLIRSSLGSRPPEVYYQWKPLYQLSATEMATVEKTYADALTARVNTGLFDQEVLGKVELNRMTESGMYPGIEAAIAESGKEDGLNDPDEQEAKELERMTREAEILAGRNNKIAANDGIGDNDE